MDLATVLFSLLLLAVSGALVANHLRTWRAESDLLTDVDEAGYAWRRFRRRMQASVMIGLTGVAIFVGQWLPEHPLVYLLYWGCLLLWVFWIALLALADALATQRYFSQLHRDHLVEQVRLQSELRRQDVRRNGHGKESHATSNQPGSPSS